MGSKTDSVTVVIPVWGPYVNVLPDAIASVRVAAHPPRVIIIDNASEPPIGPLDGCEVVRTDVRLSKGAIRNLGLDLVRTEYVIFLDADDLLLPGAIEHLIDGLDRSPQAPAFVGAIVEASGERHRTPRRLSRVLAHAAPRLFAWANAVWSLLPIQGCAILRAASVRECGGYPDASAGEDWVLGASLAFRGPIVFDEEPVLVYRFRHNSPGVQPASTRELLENAARVRACLRADPDVSAGTPPRALLMIAQWLAVFMARPLVRGVRAGRSGRARGREFAWRPARIPVRRGSITRSGSSESSPG